MAWARHFIGFGLNRLFVLLRADGSAQRDISVLGDDLDVFRVRRKRLVACKRTANVSRELKVGRITRLLSCCGVALVAIPLIGPGIVRRSGLPVRVPGRQQESVA